MANRKSSRGRVFNYPSSLPKFPTGGEVKPEDGTKQPIYVNDPNDPRLQMYNDSLTIYNTGQMAKKLVLENIPKFKELEKNKASYEDFYKSGIALNNKLKTIKGVTKDYSEFKRENNRTGINPVKNTSEIGKFTYNTGEGDKFDWRYFTYDSYKPTQPILYKPWEKLELEELERKQYSSAPQQPIIEKVPDVKLPNTNAILKTGFNVKYPSSEFYKPANQETVRDVFQNGGQIVIDKATKLPKLKYKA